MFYIAATSASTLATWFRELLFSINETVYKFIASVYTFMLDLAVQGNNIVEKTNISDATNKIYALIGVIMLFRLGIVILKYIADPDKVSDKKDGIGPKVISRTVVVLALLVLTPTLFGWMYDIQTAVLKSSLLTNFFSSGGVANSAASAAASTTANNSIADEVKAAQEALAAAQAQLDRDNQDFIQAEAELTAAKAEHAEAFAAYDAILMNGNATLAQTKAAKARNDDTKAEVVSKQAAFDIAEQAVKDAQSRVDTATAALTGSQNKNIVASGSKFADVIMMSFITPNGVPASKSKYDEQVGLLKNSNEVYAQKPIDYSIISKFLSEKKGAFYEYEYSGLIALITGIVVLVMLLATIFKVALRIFKLIAYEIMAPIPIVMYLDPTSKAGESVLEKWFKAIIDTFLDLFLRILLIGFAAMIIANLSSYMQNSSSPILLQLFMIIGALMFMNVGPDLIMSLFGKKAEKGGFNPLAQMSSMAGVGAASVGAAGAVAGMGMGAVKGFAGGGPGVLNKLKGAAAGTTYGAKTGFRTGSDVGNQGGSLKNIGAIQSKHGGAVAKEMGETAKANSKYEADNKARKEYNADPANADKKIGRIPKVTTNPFGQNLHAANSRQQAVEKYRGQKKTEDENERTQSNIETGIRRAGRPGPGPTP